MFADTFDHFTPMTLVWAAMFIVCVNLSPFIFLGSPDLRAEVGSGACQLPSASCLFPLLFSLSLQWHQGHAGLFQLHLVTAMNSMTNPWGFGSPISLGQCCELSWSRCLGCPDPLPCYDSGLHSHGPNYTLLPSSSAHDVRSGPDQVCLGKLFVQFMGL